MPIPRPPQPAGIILPPVPEDPPTLEDVTAAKLYQTHTEVALDSHGPAGPTMADSSRADIYKTNVIISHSAMDVEPAWLEPAIDRILNNRLAPIKIALTKLQNNQRSDGTVMPFVIVPFEDGSLPTEDPHNLPHLTNVTAINRLNPAQKTAYLNGYQKGNPRAKRVAIAQAIGCRAPVS